MIEGDSMADRDDSSAFQMLPKSARRVFAAIERTIGDGSSASVSYVDFMLDHHMAPKVVSPSLKLLDRLGLIEIETGRRGSNVFRLSNRWRGIDEAEAKELTREVKPHRTFEKRPEVSRERVAKLATLKLPKPMTVERRPYRRRVPSLPQMPWQDDGR
jgi:hypothetical protein